MWRHQKDGEARRKHTCSEYGSTMAAVRRRAKLGGLLDFEREAGLPEAGLKPKLESANTAEVRGAKDRRLAIPQPVCTVVGVRRRRWRRDRGGWRRCGPERFA